MTLGQPAPAAVRCVAIIPARGGSKGVPGKNLATVGGTSLIARAVRAARRADRVDLVVVSTDDEDIARAGRAAGAIVVHRPAALATDEATSEAAVLHALDALAAEGAEPDICVLVQCTSPFVAPGDIDGVVALVAEGGADTALTAAPSHAFVWREDGDTSAGVNHDPSGRPRRQDRDPEFVETGAAYAMRVTDLRRTGHRFSGCIRLHVTSRAGAIEIDEADDLAMADAWAPLVDRTQLADALPTAVGAVVFDFDGVMTDDRALVLEDGREAVTVSRGDGLGIEQLRQRGVPMLILSKEANGVVAARAAKLGVEVLQGVDDKWTRLAKWLDERDLPPADVVYVGNDVNDVECLTNVGCGLAVADARAEARSAACWVLNHPGGRGAVREVADAVIDRLDAAVAADPAP